MYKWLKAYIEQFGKDFPLSAVIDHTEYEICRMIQECCESGTEFTVPEETAVVGEARVGESTVAEGG